MNKLPDVEPFRQRYNELEIQLSDPEVFKNAHLASALSKEHNTLKSILSISDQLQSLETQLLQSQELLEDQEFAVTAKEDIDLIEARIVKLTTLTYHLRILPWNIAKKKSMDQTISSGKRIDWIG